jgi:hypothetical protein
MWKERKEMMREPRPNRDEAIDALNNYVAAAIRLSDTWHPILDKGYPTCLPSFDEHVAELQEWRNHADA